MTTTSIAGRVPTRRTGTRTPRSRWFVFGALVLLAASIVYPLFFLVTSSLRTNSDYLNGPLQLPGVLTFENFIIVWNDYGAGQAFLNSLRVVSIALCLSLMLSTAAGYAMAKLPVPGARIVTGTFVSVMLIPSQVLILPIYLMLSRIGLVGDYAGLILVYVASNLPFGVFFLSVAFKAIPDEILEACRLDGAGFLRTMFSIVLPIGGSSIATLAVLQFLGMWNELLYAFILLPDNTKTLLTPALAQIGERYLNEQPLVSAGLLLTASIPLLLLMFASRYIMRGLAAGALR